MLLKPRIVPAPIICPKLVVAINSGKPNPFKFSKGIDGPRPFTFIAYLPMLTLKMLHTIMINAIFPDHMFVTPFIIFIKFIINLLVSSRSL